MMTNGMFFDDVVSIPFLSISLSSVDGTTTPSTPSLVGLPGVLLPPSLALVISPNQGMDPSSPPPYVSIALELSSKPKNTIILHNRRTRQILVCLEKP